MLLYYDTDADQIIMICFVLFSLVWFYSISTTVGYLIPNPVCVHILDLYDL